MKLTLKDYLRAILSTSDPKTKEEWEEYFWIEEKIIRGRSKV